MSNFVTDPAVAYIA